MAGQPVTPALIKELRDRSGVGMGKCKEALDAAGGDIELAISNLRKAGIASAVKKEGRATNEGIVGFAESPKAIGLVEVNAETDFVVRNERFQQFVAEVAKEIAETSPASLDAFKQQKWRKDPSMTVEEYRAVLVQTIGENIQIRRLAVLPKAPNRSIGLYSHQGGKMVTAVQIEGSDAESAFAKEIAMHVAAAAPEYLSPEQIPSDLIAHERDIAKSQVVGKPEHIIDKIVDGKLQSFYDSSCLLRQKYIKDDRVTVNDLVNQRAKASGKSLAVGSFIRWAVGSK